MRRRIAIVGAGNVGSTAAQFLALRGHADIVLVDVNEGHAKGKALDIQEAAPILGFDTRLVGTANFADIAGCELVIITAGAPRRPGMSRDDLLLTNADIVRGIVRQVCQHAPDALMLMVTNPLDAMTYLAFKITGLPRQRVMGMSGVLDSARFRTFVAEELGCYIADVSAYVLGGHGETMLPVVGMTTVAGIPVTRLVSPERLEAVIQRTRDGGTEIVNLLQTGSAFVAPAAAITQMVEAILLDRKQVLPACVHLEGEYGISGVCVGVPVKLGAGGVEEIVQVGLTPEEQAALERSAAAVKELVDMLKV